MSTSATLPDAARALKRGEAVIFPTDTVYGLGVSVRDAAGPDVLYQMKERDRGKPIAWLVASPDDLDRYGVEVPDLARRLAARYWPGPLTLIVRASDAVPEPFRSAAGTIGLRMPDNACARALIDEVGCPLATTSANLSGHASPCSFAAIDPELAARVSLALPDPAGDQTKSGLASTVLTCTPTPHIIRKGAITEADITALTE